MILPEDLQELTTVKILIFVSMIALILFILQPLMTVNAISHFLLAGQSTRIQVFSKKYLF